MPDIRKLSATQPAIATKDSTKKTVDTLALRLKKENTARIMKYFIPGYGQIQNKQWLWLGITYGGLIGGTYNFISQRNLYLQFKELRTQTFGTSNTAYSSYYDRELTDAQLKQVMNFRRRNAEVSVIGLVLGVGLQAVQANVAYHLKSFDSSDNLSLRPSINFAPKTVALALQINLYK